MSASKRAHSERIGERLRVALVGLNLLVPVCVHRGEARVADDDVTAQLLEELRHPLARRRRLKQHSCFRIAFERGGDVLPCRHAQLRKNVPCVVLQTDLTLAFPEVKADDEHGESPGCSLCRGKSLSTSP